MVGGRYDKMRGVRDVPLTSSQLTTFGLWKHVDSRLHPIGRSHETSTIPPCAMLDLDDRCTKQTMS